MKDYINDRIATLSMERVKVQEEFLRNANEQLRLVLAPYDRAIEELRKLLEWEEDNDG